MVAKSGTEVRAKPKRTPLTYFFLDDQLHKKLHINRPTDIIKAWNYPAGKKMVYNYSTVLRRMKPAFTTQQVCEMLDRSDQTINNAIHDGMIERPQMTYGIDEHRRPYKYMWREEDIMALHEYFASVHIGRPRLDGEVTNNSLPSARELRAMINGEHIFYVKQGDAFVPSWKAKEF